MSGALGNPGQADYACANAWLDAFASRRNRLRDEGRRQGDCLSIDWPYWRDGGMQLAEAQVAAMVAATGVQPLSSAQGLTALERAWAQRQAEQVLVLAGDPERLRALLGPVVAD